MAKAPLYTFLLLFILQMAHCPLFSQNPASQEETAIRLHEGALLVRLKTGKKQIEAFQAQGDIDRVNALKMKLHTENQKVIKAFSLYYRFSEVFYFYSDDKEQIKKGSLEGVLLDKNSALINANPSYFIVAGLDIAPHSGIPCILLRDNQLNVLTGSLPSVFRTYSSMAKMDAGLKKGVLALEKKLTALHRKAKRRLERNKENEH